MTIRSGHGEAGLLEYARKAVLSERGERVGSDAWVIAELPAQGRVDAQPRPALHLALIELDGEQLTAQVPQRAAAILEGQPERVIVRLLLAL